MFYLVALINYQGQYTHGFQKQFGQHFETIENYILNAIESFCGERPENIDCAGRTDKGVHAINQVIGFDISIQRLPARWVTGLNHFLPEFISVQSVRFFESSKTFHPRFSAQSRTYRYYFLSTAHRSLAQIFPRIPKHYDFELLQRCAEFIKGPKNFSAFQGGSCQAQSTQKTCLHAQWSQQGPLLIFDIQANAFLQHMVRYLVGSQVAVALGEKDLTWFTSLFQSQARAQDYCAEPSGLYLCDVQYAQELERYLNKKTQESYPWFDQRSWGPSLGQNDL